MIIEIIFYSLIIIIITNNLLIIYSLLLAFILFWLIYSPNTAWKVSKYGVFSGLYFPVFGPEKILRIWTLFTQCNVFRGNKWEH